MVHFSRKPSIELAVLLIFSFNRLQTSALLSKCCPIGSEMNIQTGNLPNCIKQDNATDWDLYNVKVSKVETQFPQCDYGVKQIFQASTNVSLLNGCLDKSIDGNLYTIRCKDQPTVAVHKLNKCCPVNQSFDYERRFCVSSLDSIVRFRELFGDAVVIFEPKTPNCTGDDVFVEFHSTNHDIAFVDRNLRIKTEYFPAGQLLRINQYCIESILNNDDDKEGISDIIVWSCQPKDVVEKFPHVVQCMDNENELEFDKPLCRNGKKIGEFDLCTFGFIVSCVFLAMTLIVYLSLPKVCCFFFLNKIISNFSSSIRLFIIDISHCFPAVGFARKNTRLLCYIVIWSILYTGGHTYQHRQKAHVLLRNWY